MHPLRRPLGITNPLSPPPTLGANIRDRPLTVLRSLLSFTPAFGEPPPEPTTPPPLDVATPRSERSRPPMLEPPEVATPIVRHAAPSPPQPQQRPPLDWQASDYRRPHRLP